MGAVAVTPRTQSVARSMVATRSVYISAMEPGSGKSVAVLGLMETLSARVERLGFFRPIVPSATEPDPKIELIRRRYQLDLPVERMFALSEEEADGMIAAGAQDELVKRVVDAYRELERDCDFVVTEGTDFAGAAPALDFDLNAELANHLASPVLIVVRGTTVDGSVAAVRTAREALTRAGCAVFGVMVNRVPPDVVAELSSRLAPQDGEDPVYVLPEQEELAIPTMAEVAATLGAEVVVDGDGTLDREVREVRVAAMSVEHFLEDLADGTLVIVPGDRADILVASLAATHSKDLPAVAGILLTAGYEVSPTVRHMLESAPFPVLSAPHRTYAAATAVHGVRPLITADNERKIATALGLFDAGVDASDLEGRIALQRPARKTPVMFEYDLIERAKGDRRHIVLPEGDDDRVLRAADILLRRGVVDLTILGDEDEVRSRAAALGADLGAAQIVDPETSPLRDDFGARYHEVRKHKGVTEELALDVMRDVTYFGTMMVHSGQADGMVSGAAHTTGDTIRPAFEFVKARKGVSVVSSVFFMCLADRVLVYGDCAVNPNPDPNQLADIAISSADTAAAFGIRPRVAMLSYSTGESAKGPAVDAVREATGYVQERRPDLGVEGPIQYDAAIDPHVASLKAPESEVAGRATVFIFPDLETGNVSYKAVQRAANTVAIGPVLQGLNKPVNDLSRGCKVPDVVNTVAITAIQAQQGAE
jgi:phosphate acetyltransferase